MYCQQCKPPGWGLPPRSTPGDRSRRAAPRGRRATKPLRRRSFFQTLTLGLLLAAAAGTGARLIAAFEPGPAAAGPLKAPAPASPPARALTKQELQPFLAAHNFLNATETRVSLKGPEGCLTVQTSIDPGLQEFLVQRLDQRHSRYIGIVVMDPADGRILAMAGYDKANPTANPCLENRFPAASIFKIITAAAAVEVCDLEPDSPMDFQGGKYTLYRSQIEDRRTRSANRISLKDSFAQSINPVFGKLGVHALGREVIESYAAAFGFNREIDFELPIRPSRIELSDEAFELAEVASGFNRSTRISPLHGALMAAAILNGGRLVDPTLIDWATDESGRTVYQSRFTASHRAVDPPTATVLREMMRATVQSGTARREFAKHHDDRILARLDIGGKTGSMGDGQTSTRYDWFVGFAEDQRLSARVVFSVVVAHEEFIGTRAAAYAAMAIKEYFRTQFARLEAPGARPRERG
jgi:cell division protein FtsI/penicillin-binding protein 2